MPDHRCPGHAHRLRVRSTVPGRHWRPLLRHAVLYARIAGELPSPRIAGFGTASVDDGERLRGRSASASKRFRPPGPAGCRRQTMYPADRADWKPPSGQSRPTRWAAWHGASKRAGYGFVGSRGRPKKMAPHVFRGALNLVRPKGLEPLLQAPEACVISTSPRAQLWLHHSTISLPSQTPLGAFGSTVRVVVGSRSSCLVSRIGAGTDAFIADLAAVGYRGPRRRHPLRHE